MRIITRGDFDGLACTVLLSGVVDISEIRFGHPKDAQDGKIKKVAVNTYLITPYNVDLLGDLIDELENNGLYF